MLGRRKDSGGRRETWDFLCGIVRLQDTARPNRPWNPEYTITPNTINGVLSRMRGLSRGVDPALDAVTPALVSISVASGAVNLLARRGQAPPEVRQQITHADRKSSITGCRRSRVEPLPVGRSIVGGEVAGAHWARNTSSCARAGALGPQVSV